MKKAQKIVSSSLSSSDSFNSQRTKNKEQLTNTKEACLKFGIKKEKEIKQSEEY